MFLLNASEQFLENDSDTQGPFKKHLKTIQLTNRPFIDYLYKPCTLKIQRENKVPCPQGAHSLKEKEWLQIIAMMYGDFSNRGMIYKILRYKEEI